MITIKIRIKTDGKIYTESLFLEDEYVISKSNPDFESKVKKACENSHFETIEEVKITSKMEW